MKGLLVVVLLGLLAAHAQAGILDDIRAAISGTFGDMKEVGKAIIAKALEHGKTLGKQALQALIGSVMKNAQGIGSEDEMNMMDLLKEGASKLEALLNAKVSAMKMAYETVMDKIKEIFEKFNPETIEDEMDSLVAMHEMVQRNIFTDLIGGLRTKLTEFVKKGLSTILGKFGMGTPAEGPSRRFIVPAMQALSEWGKKLGEFFKPHVDKLVEHVKTVGGMVKGHVTNAANMVKQHLAGLGDKLKTHVDTLREHGKAIAGHGIDALNQARTAIVDILKGTYDKMAPHIQGAIDAQKNVIGTIIKGNKQ